MSYGKPEVSHSRFLCIYTFFSNDIIKQNTLVSNQIHSSALYDKIQITGT